MDDSNKIIKQLIFPVVCLKELMYRNANSKRWYKDCSILIVFFTSFGTHSTD